ncbi:MAG: HYR domain-containing protein, partial [Candidatus Atribacteria bacterium]
IGDDVTDNIGILSLVCTHTSGDAFPVGVTTVTYTATDLSGNTTDYAFTVTVIDDELPVIAGMPSDICIEVPAGVTEMAVSWIEPTASDNCGIASLVGSHVPGSLFPLGKTSVGYVAEDIHGNIAPANFGITVAEAWQLACTDKYAATSNPSGTKVSFADPVTGGCGVSVTFDPASGSFFDVGDTEVMCEVTDDTRTETCTFTVTVEFVNHDPIAVADVVEMDDFEISTEIEVLANDSDADDDELTVIDVSTSSPCGEVWIDPDGQSVWFIGMYCQPYLGGTVTFSYTVSDGNGGEDAATVRIQLPDSGTMPEVAEPPTEDR